MRRPFHFLIPALFLCLMAYIVYEAFTQSQVRCKACVEFKGQTACRTASGENRQAALEAAVDNACGELTQGMAELMTCRQKPPVSVECDLQ